MSPTLFAMLCRECKEGSLIYVGQRNGSSVFCCEKCKAEITFSARYMKRFKPVVAKIADMGLSMIESSLGDGPWFEPPKQCPECGEVLNGKLEPDVLTIHCACGHVLEKRRDDLWYMEEMKEK